MVDLMNNEPKTKAHFLARVQQRNMIQIPSLTHKLLNIEPSDIVRITIQIEQKNQGVKGK